MNRRAFLQKVACAPVLGAVHPFRLRAQAAEPAFAYVATPDAICVFAIKARQWTLVQTVSSGAPSFLAVHPRGKYLYAANEIDQYEGIPRGTVEAYVMDAHTGHLDLLNRRPLSLSATNPRYLTISPDGKTLGAAAHGGGAYNLFAIEPDGSVGKIVGIRKELGCGPQVKYQSTAHPYALVFHPAGQYLIATDLGCDRISSFARTDDTLVRRGCTKTLAGSGPGALVFHPSGSVLYVVHELRPIISCHRFHPDTGETEQPFQIVNGEHFAGPSEAALAISSRGDFLYSARASERTVTAWAIDSASGALLRHDSRRDVSSSICALHAAPSSLYSLCKGSDAIVQLSIDSMNGKFGEAARVALVKSPRAIVMI